MFQIFKKCCSKGAANHVIGQLAALTFSDPRRTRLAQPNRAESGIAAVEFAMVLPVMLMIVLGIMQFGSIFHIRNAMTDVARQAARSLSVGEVNETSAKQTALDSLSAWSMTFTVVTSMPDPSVPTDRDVSVNISVPLSQASIVDFLGLFATGNVASSVTMRMEGLPAP